MSTIPEGSRGGWRESRWLAVAEFAAVALIFIADAKHLIFFSKTPFLLLLGWLSLRVRRLRWRDVGLTRFRGWKITLGLGIALGVLTESFAILVTQPFLAWMTGKQPDLEDFRILQGNVPYSLAALALSWSLAAFGEEMVWRGYLLNRAADLFGRTRTGWIAGTLAVSAAFGCAHSYQGVAGTIVEGLAGLLLALIYLGCRRNLAVPIIAHGVQDSIDVVLIFLGKLPGL
jgi:CAAX protease family protein